MSATATQSADPVTEELRLLRIDVARLMAIVTSRLALPVDSLSVKQAAERLGCKPGKVYSLLALGVFTEARGDGGRGSPHRVLSDELDVYRFEGEEQCRRFRKSLGRA